MLSATEVIFGMVGLMVLLVGVIGYFGMRTLIRLRLPKSEKEGRPDGSPTE